MEEPMTKPEGGAVCGLLFNHRVVVGFYLEFLQHIRSRKLILNDDIIDGCALQHGGCWHSSHSRVIP